MADRSYDEDDMLDPALESMREQRNSLRVEVAISEDSNRALRSELEATRLERDHAIMQGGIWKGHVKALRDAVEGLLKEAESRWTVSGR